MHPDVDFETQENLINGGILDSFDIVTLVTEITEEFVDYEEVEQNG